MVEQNQVVRKSHDPTFEFSPDQIARTRRGIVLVSVECGVRLRADIENNIYVSLVLILSSTGGQQEMIGILPIFVSF
jgi:hypothetical protein